MTHHKSAQQCHNIALQNSTTYASVSRRMKPQKQSTTNKIEQTKSKQNEKSNNIGRTLIA